MKKHTKKITLIKKSLCISILTLAFITPSP